jgi:hypothetical protein
VRLHPRAPDRLYQQNHCGIYRIDRPADRWTDIGAAMPKVGGADRLSDGAAPARSGHAVGVSDGWLGRVAAHLAWRQAGRLPVGQRRQDVAAPGDRLPKRKRGGR